MSLGNIFVKTQESCFSCWESSSVVSLSMPSIREAHGVIPSTANQTNKTKEKDDTPRSPYSLSSCGKNVDNGGFFNFLFPFINLNFQWAYFTCWITKIMIIKMVLLFLFKRKRWHGCFFSTQRLGWHFPVLL